MDSISKDQKWLYPVMFCLFVCFTAMGYLKTQSILFCKHCQKLPLNTMLHKREQRKVTLSPQKGSNSWALCVPCVWKDGEGYHRNNTTDPKVQLLLPSVLLHCSIISI